MRSVCPSSETHRAGFGRLGEGRDVVTLGLSCPVASGVLAPLTSCQAEAVYGSLLSGCARAEGPCPAGAATLAGDVSMTCGYFCSSEDDGTRISNHRIDSVVTAACGNVATAGNYCQARSRFRLGGSFPCLTSPAPQNRSPSRQPGGWPSRRGCSASGSRRWCGGAASSPAPSSSRSGPCRAWRVSA